MGNTADWILRLGLNSSGVKTGINQATSDLNGFANRLDGFIGKVSGLGSTFRTALEGFAIGKIFLQANEELDKLIQKAKDIRVGVSRTGLDSTTFQQVSNVSGARGSSPEAAEKAMEKTADAIQTIRDGADEGAKLQTAMARLGVTMDDIKKKNHQQVFFEIAENMKHVEVTTERLAALNDIFGKHGHGAGELIPVFKEGFDGKIANRGVLGEGELSQLAFLDKLTKESKEPYEAIGREAALRVGQAKAAMLSLPSLIYGYFAGPEDRTGEAQQRAMSQRDVENKEKKAEADAAKAAVKKKKDEAEKRAKEIAKEYAEEQKRAAKEQVESARPARRRQILLERDRAIDERINSIDAAIRNGGDPDGSLALQRLKLVNQRSENRRGIFDIDTKGKGFSLLPEHTDQKTRIGLFTGRSDSGQRIFQQQLSELQKQVQKLNSIDRGIQNLREDYNE